MNVYSLDSDCDHYESLTLVEEANDWETMYQFNATPIGSAWRPLRVESLTDDDDSAPLLPGDFPLLFPGAPVLSRRAVEVLQPILEGNGELLQLDCDVGEYFIFNITKVVDALNEKDSEIVKFLGSQKVMTIKSFSFVSQRLKGVGIFKLPQLRLGRSFVTDRFAQAVEKGGLVGFSLEWLWSSDQSSGSPPFKSKTVQ
ncbi:MAG TPA: DUF1629 domain-containing protein [Pyrinomonadaceae bacterium]